MLLKNLKNLKSVIKNDTTLTSSLDLYTLKHGSIDPDGKSVKILLDMVKKGEIHPRDVTMFHPSAAYSCMRSQLLAVLGFSSIHDIDIRRDNIFDDGKWRHLRWQTLFARMGILHDAEVKIIYEDWFITGSADAIVNINNQLYLVEIKGANDFIFTRCKRQGAPIEGHLWQAVCYTAALRNMGLKIKSAIIFYENKNNQDLWEYVISEEKYLEAFKELRRRYRKMNIYRQKRRLSSFECTLREDDSKFRNCGQKLNCMKEMEKKNYPHDELNEDIVRLAYASREKKGSVRLVKVRS